MVCSGTQHSGDLPAAAGLNFNIFEEKYYETK